MKPFVKPRKDGTVEVTKTSEKTGLALQAFVSPKVTTKKGAQFWPVTFNVFLGAVGEKFSYGGKGIAFKGRNDGDGYRFNPAADQGEDNDGKPKYYNHFNIGDGLEKALNVIIEEGVDQIGDVGASAPDTDNTGVDDDDF